MDDQKNLLLAIVLTGVVLIGWQFLFAVPQLEKQKQIAQQQQTQVQQPPPNAQPGTPPQIAPGTVPQAPGLPNAAPTQTREAALAASPRVRIDTPRLSGSLALMGGRIDDLALLQYRETVDPNSPPIVLLAPSGSPQPFYAEFGWTGAAGTSAKLPGPDTLWRQEGAGALSVGHPVTLVYDNGEGLAFRRSISVDDKYLFTIKDSVANSGTAAVTLYPYALISRHGTPPTLGYYILHEGLIGVMGEQGLQELTYKKVEDQKTPTTFDVTDAWLGFTDKYWAATLLPDTDARIHAKFSFGLIGQTKTYQTDYLLDPQTIAPGGSGSADARLFAGAKEVTTVGINFPLGGFGGYNQQLHLNKFDLLIDWGYFWFITKPMFLAIDFFFHLVGNFGVAILIITVVIKGIFFPLANKSYASMAKMKAVQPEMTAIRARYADDKVKQQQAMMELYKRDKINPVAGCLPIAIQIPVFFSLYKVLFVTIEMRHAPFFGWIKDLSAPDPTNVFNLFGLIPFDPTVLPVFGSFLHLGAWPLIMGITMFLQMKLNPPPPDPAQQVIFNWMPVIFTFMLANFSAGLVIYWAWNNTLSVTQQSIIMHKHGAKIELWDNLKGLFVRKKPAER
ncbi:MAG TPA: membrane protein insertase YidC [Xanthobacteraceae bacterium]|jgi:YidC/Oxa1 family membrane protein insertase